jgi:putative hydrolase
MSSPTKAPQADLGQPSRGPLELREHEAMATDPSPFGDVPFFRELQRLLASSGSGPVNEEIARQVAQAIATEGRTESPPSSERARLMQATVRDSELVLAGYTRLSIDEPIQSASITRTQWIDVTFKGWKWLIDHLAERFVTEMSRASTEGEDQMRQVMGQVTPLLMGVQAGTLVGHLAREVLATNDPPIPRDGEADLFIVEPNVDAFAAGYDLDATEVTRWLSLHDVARALVIHGVSWVNRYHRSLLTELVDAIEIDMSQLERRLMDLQSGGLEALQTDEGIDRSIPLVASERHQSALSRLRAFVGVFEGYASHAADSVRSTVVEDSPRIQEAIARQQSTPSEGEELLANLLGFSADRELEASGRTFCEAVVQLEGLTRLNLVWDAPDNLPSYAELKDPFKWIERVTDA